MEKPIVVGKKISKGILVLVGIVAVLIAWGASRFFKSVFHSNMAGTIAFILFLLIAILLYLPTIAVDNTYWSIDSKYLTYYNVKNNGFHEEMAYVINLLKGKENASIKIALGEIEHLHLYWRKVQFYVWNHHAYVVMLGITLKDGSRLAFQGLYDDSEVFVQAIDWLHDNTEIQITDPDGLMNVLRNPKINLYEYLNQLKGNPHG